MTNAGLKRGMRPLALLATMFVLLSGGPYGLEGWCRGRARAWPCSF